METKQQKWQDPLNGNVFEVGQVVKVYDEEKEDNGKNENYKIVGFNFTEDDPSDPWNIAECVQLDDNGNEIGFYQFLCEWLIKQEEVDLYF